MPPSRSRCGAAVPLADVLKFTAEARAYREQLQHRQSEHAPLIQRLSDAASKLVAALNVEACGLRQNAGQHNRESAARRSSAKERRQQVSQCASRAARAESESSALEQRLADGETRWRRLQTDGVATESETSLSVQTTVARLAKDIDALHAELADMETQRSEKATERESLSHRHEATLLSLRSTEAQTKECERLMAGMFEARNAIASNQTLLTLLQVETAEVDRVCPEAISLAKSQRRLALEAILDLRLGRADDERALEFLKDYGRMPPTHDVLAVLDVLRHHGIACWSGWEYLEANVSREQRRLVVRRRPHLAGGVIVAGVDTLDSLPDSTSMEHLAGPVAIAAAEHLLSAGSPSDFVVWGPTHDALFDATAAGRAGGGNLAAHRQVAEAEDRREQWRQAVESLLQQLEQYGKSYPAGWLEKARTRQEQMRKEVAQMNGELAAISARDLDLHTWLTQLAEKAKDLHFRELDLRDASRRATDFCEQYGQHLSSWQDKRREFQQEVIKETARQFALRERSRRG